MKKILGFFISYIFIAFLISIPWQGMTSLNSWDRNFHLVLGNEGTGDRPWQGYISQVYISDRAISQSEVKQILSNDNYFEQNKGSLIADYQLNQNSRSLSRSNGKFTRPNLERRKTTLRHKRISNKEKHL